MSRNPLFPFKSKTSALIDGDAGTVLSYSQLEKECSKFEGFFPEEKSLIFIFAKNSLQDVIAYLAAVSMGHVVALLDDRLHPPLKKEMIRAYGPDYVLSAKEDIIEGYTLIDAPYKHLNGWKIASTQQGPELHPDLQLLLSSSGTTGNPKMIKLSRKNIIANAESIVKYLALNPNENAIASLPIHYSYGLSVLHSHLCAGATTTFTRQSFMQKPFWDIFQKYGCTSFAGVPYAYEMLDRISFESFHLPTLKMMTQAGGALKRELIVKFDHIMKARGGQFWVMYGQTEATARISYVPPELLPEKAGSIGIAIPGGSLKIINDEIVYEGPNVMMGYAEGKKDLAKGDELHGVLFTEDLGYQDKEGLFYLTGRSRRICKVYGYRINLDDVERQFDSIARVAAISDDMYIYIYFEEGDAAQINSMAMAVAERYHLHWSSVVCRKIGLIPLTRSGKFDYKQLAKWLIKQ